MAVYIKGDPVANATSYKLSEKKGSNYTQIAEASEINFEVSAMGLSAGEHILVIKASASGYADSDYSNEVTYVADNAYLLNLDFATNTLSNMVSRGVITLDTTPSVAVVQDENGICMNGAYPNGFKLTSPITIPSKWCLEYVATHPTKFASDTTNQHYGILAGSSGVAPCVMSNKQVCQIRFNTNDNARISSNDGYFLYDGKEHVYRIECVGNYTVDVYRDDEVFQSGLTLTQGSATGLGTWHRLLGLPSDYTATSAIFKSDGSFYCKSIKLWELK